MNLLSTRTLALAAVGSFLTAGVATAAPFVIEDFATDEGARTFGNFRTAVNPGGAGQNTGASAGSTSISLTQWEFTPPGDTVFVNNLSITDDNLFPGGTNEGVTTAWTLRHLANGGAPGASNLVSTSGNVGSVGFYLRTTEEDLSVRIALDETGGSGGTEGSIARAAIADGQWHLYQWSLADDSQWTPFFGTSNGSLDGTTYTVDSIFFYELGPEDGETSTFDLTYVTADNAGPLVNLVPEPASLALLLAGGSLLLGRRRTA